MNPEFKEAFDDFAGATEATLERALALLQIVFRGDRDELPTSEELRDHAQKINNQMQVVFAFADYLDELERTGHDSGGSGVPR